MKRYKFLNILGTLNGYKQAVKTCHWNETESMNKHEQLDNLYDLLHNFQDAFAEDGIQIFGKINLTDIPNINISFYSIDGLIDEINDYVLRLKKLVNKVSNNELFAGLNSLCDNLVHDMHIFMYRFRMN